MTPKFPPLLKPPQRIQKNLLHSQQQHWRYYLRLQTNNSFPLKTHSLLGVFRDNSLRGAFQLHPRSQQRLQELIDSNIKDIVDADVTATASQGYHKILGTKNIGPDENCRR